MTPAFNRVTANGVSTTNTENHADNRYIGFGVNYQNAKHGWMAIRNYFSPEGHRKTMAKLQNQKF